MADSDADRIPWPAWLSSVHILSSTTGIVACLFVVVLTRAEPIGWVISAVLAVVCGFIYFQGVRLNKRPMIRRHGTAWQINALWWPLPPRHFDIEDYKAYQWKDDKLTLLRTTKLNGSIGAKKLRLVGHILIRRKLDRWMHQAGLIRL